MKKNWRKRPANSITNFAPTIFTLWDRKNKRFGSACKRKAGSRRNGEIMLPRLQKIKAVLGQEYPNVSAYRRNPASIRLRILDEKFRGKPRTARQKMLLPLIHELPEEIQQDIVVLLLLTPEEAKASPMNFEFEKPSSAPG